MGKQLAFVLINPYTIAKSRTGGVIARYTGRTDLRFVAARMFGPSAELAQQYAELVRHADPDNAYTCGLIADYVERNYAPDPATGRPRRVMMLLFEGEDAVRKIWEITGCATATSGRGETIRDTYGDYIVDGQNRVVHFEPAVLVGPSDRRVGATLSLWARHSESDGGVIDAALDVLSGESVEKTLVLLKPDNFRGPSFRPGSIIDLLSSSGLRIVGVKKFCMTVAQAMEFYGPVRRSLEKKFRELGRDKVCAALSRELGVRLPDGPLDELCERLGPYVAGAQFEDIVHFMTGYRPSECASQDAASLAREGCLALVYQGRDAVNKIRSIIGTTDPSKAQFGSVRREFGHDIMMNAAHASDSVANAQREMDIIRVGEDSIRQWVSKYYG